MPLGFVQRKSCPACGSIPFHVLLSCSYLAPALWRGLSAHYQRIDEIKPSLENAEYTLLQCPQCELVYQRWVPNDALLRVVYGDWYPADAPPLDQAPPFATRDGQEVFAAAESLSRSPKGLRVYDYGMGWGAWAIMAARMGCRASGIEYSEEKNAFASKHGVTITKAEALDAESFDFINVDQVLEHVLDPGPVLKTLARALCKDGILKISVPKANDIERRLARGNWTLPAHHRETLNPVWPFEHVNLFNTRALVSLATSAGLTPRRLPRGASYTFLQHTQPTQLSRPIVKELAKGLARPLYHRYSRHNLYMWFTRS